MKTFPRIPPPPRSIPPYRLSAAENLSFCSLAPETSNRNKSSLPLHPSFLLAFPTLPCISNSGSPNLGLVLRPLSGTGLSGSRTLAPSLAQCTPILSGYRWDRTLPSLNSLLHSSLSHPILADTPLPRFCILAQLPALVGAPSHPLVETWPPKFLSPGELCSPLLSTGTLNPNKSCPPFLPALPLVLPRCPNPQSGAPQPFPAPHPRFHTALSSTPWASFPRASPGPVSLLLLPSQARDLEGSGLLSGWVGQVGVGGRGWGRGLMQQVGLRGGFLGAPGTRGDPSP